MDHKLAEQLRDAGFPQSGEGRRIGALTAFVWRARDLVYVPTLEELLAACGDEFGEMARLGTDPKSSLVHCIFDFHDGPHCLNLEEGQIRYLSASCVH